ncbi:MAG: amidophosphoribosyltransferase [Bacteroidetes bacterium]|nr:MAG: amidophosphoribosyltransferase [Bacteroidota bacterium]
MSDLIKHECGIGMIRLLKPLDYYKEKYGSALWGLNKLYLLMEKQRNRGQDGAGIACMKLNVRPGYPFHARLRNNEPSPWTNIFKELDKQLAELRQQAPEKQHNAKYLKQHYPFAGEVLMGHLRYGTHGSYDVNTCHPVIRTSNYKTRCLMLAGNFNLTNVDDLFRKLVELGQHPRHQTDTETVLERFAYFLDVENDKLLSKYEKEGYTRGEAYQLASTDLNIHKIIKHVAKAWDGGYVIGGIIGNGDAFIMRDPNGIRPCYYYYNDEYFVAASERSAVCTVFDLHPDDILALEAGHAICIKGESKKISSKAFSRNRGQRASCSFERIYFSRGNDIKIYQERKELGRCVAPKVLERINYDYDNTIWGFVPNTAESSFWGMVQAVEERMNEDKIRQIMALGEQATEEQLRTIINKRARAEKVILKDVKMRTFIADDTSRDDLVAHVYDITRGIVNTGKDTLVCIDDSIVRGTTLRKSILHMLVRLKPKKIIIVSSAPQIRYPDCYGIDMSRIDKLVAFQAAIALLKERGMQALIEEVYHEIKDRQDANTMHEKNVVKRIYAPFTEDEISEKITALVRPDDFSAELDIVFQPLENLRIAIPNHPGDWYFSGNYPTDGGFRVVNQAFLNYYEGKNERAYQLGVG